MLVVFWHIFVADAKIIFRFDFVGALKYFLYHNLIFIFRKEL